MSAVLIVSVCSTYGVRLPDPDRPIRLRCCYGYGATRGAVAVNNPTRLNNKWVGCLWWSGPDSGCVEAQRFVGIASDGQWVTVRWAVDGDSAGSCGW